MKGTEDEIYDSFLSMIEQLEIPLIIRWICWLLFNEAKQFFPDGIAPFQSVTGFFFLRGIGGYLSTSDDPSVLANFKVLQNLFNFSKKIKDQGFVDRFKNLLLKLSVEVESNDSFPLTSEVEKQYGNYLIDFLNSLLLNQESIIESVEEKKQVGQNPVLTFLIRMIEMSKAMTFAEFSQ